jgi:hypothetical protein
VKKTRKAAGPSTPGGVFVPRPTDAPYRIWGEDLDPSAVQQLKHACRLPIAVAGALMPDAHQGYGLPIGGVLATRDAVIPYAVGVDIAAGRRRLRDAPRSLRRPRLAPRSDRGAEDPGAGRGPLRRLRPTDARAASLQWAAAPMGARPRAVLRLEGRERPPSLSTQARSAIGLTLEDARMFNLALTEDQLDMLRSAIDSHIYWQLSDPLFRRDGDVVDPGTDVVEDAELIAAYRALDAVLAGAAQE